MVTACAPENEGGLEPPPGAATDNDSLYDSQSQGNNSYEDESFSDDPDDSD